MSRFFSIFTCKFFESAPVNEMSLITIYSQNVSCDIHSKKLEEMLGRDYSFEKRFTHVLESIPTHENVDVIAFNEVRHFENVNLVVSSLKNRKFNVKAFPNNDDAMSFNNVLAVADESDWEIVSWNTKWLAVDEDTEQPCLTDNEGARVEGDRHGRCAGFVYLKHKKTKRQVCVLVSHVVPFDKPKYTQQDALFSLNKENVSKKAPIPTIIVGDLNRFWDENDKFQEHLQCYNLVEANPTELVIEKNDTRTVLKDKEDVGTFTPWPTDKNVYEDLLRTTMSKSRLDVQLYTADKSLIENTQTYVKPSMMKEPSTDTPPVGRNKTRHILDQRMASDHIAIIGKYNVMK